MNKTLAEILRAQQHTVMVPVPPLLNTRNVLPWTPTIDGDLLTDQPIRLLREGKFKKVPIMMGVTRDEAGGFVFGAVGFPIAPWLYTSVVSAWLLLYTPEYLRNYPSIYTDGRNGIVQGGGDYYFHCANRVAAKAMANQTEVYFYSFQYAHREDPTYSNIPSCQNSNYSCHGSELTSAFKTYPFFGIQRNAREIQMSDTMMKYVSSFSHGNPLDMPRYDPRSDKIMGFNLDTKILENYKKQKCDFWEAIGDYFAK
jgi:carboxylesterase type B